VIHLIANPAAGRGRGARRLAAARAALVAVDEVAVYTTERPGDEARLVRRALDDGATALAVLGGDGTWSKAGAALAGAASGCRLALLAAGTGCDWAASVGVPAGDYAAMARLTHEGGTRCVDVLRVGAEYACNVAGFGFSAAVLAAAARLPWLRGRALYAVAAAGELFGYRGIEVAVDGASAFARVLLLVAANGRRFGGGFEIAPGAELGDGALDVVEVAEAGALARMRLFAAAARGAHLGLPGVTWRRAQQLTLRFPSASFRYDADGDLRECAGSTVDVRCEPGALVLVSP
jgi:diacylglycerol kinase (ATP)